MKLEQTKPDLREGECSGYPEADPGGGAEGAIAPPFPLEHAPFLFCTTPLQAPEVPRSVRKEVPINDDEIFIAEPQPAPQSGGPNQPLPD